MNHETAELEGVDNKIAQNTKFAPERRLLEYQEFFGRFRSRKYEFAAIFGKKSADPFEEMWKVRNEINQAVTSMLMHPELERERAGDLRELWLNWYNVAFRHPEEEKDVLIPRLQAAVFAIEATCRPAIEARPA